MRDNGCTKDNRTPLSLQFCSPTRCAFQTGRNPLQVNPINAEVCPQPVPHRASLWEVRVMTLYALINAEPNVANPADPVGRSPGR